MRIITIFCSTFLKSHFTTSLKIAFVYISQTKYELRLRKIHIYELKMSSNIISA